MNTQGDTLDEDTEPLHHFSFALILAEEEGVRESTTDQEQQAHKQDVKQRARALDSKDWGSRHSQFKNFVKYKCKQLHDQGLRVQLVAPTETSKQKVRGWLMSSRSRRQCSVGGSYVLRLPWTGDSPHRHCTGSVSACFSQRVDQAVDTPRCAQHFLVQTRGINFSRWLENHRLRARCVGCTCSFVVLLVGC